MSDLASRVRDRDYGGSARQVPAPRDNHCTIFLVSILWDLAPVAMVMELEGIEVQQKERCKCHNAADNRTGNGTFRERMIPRCALVWECILIRN